MLEGDRRADALGRLNPVLGIADDPLSRERFLIEAEITGGLEHRFSGAGSRE